MRLRATLAFALVASLVVVAPVPAPAGDPNAEIEAVIADQIAAFAREDLDAAFAHAADAIRQKFGTPENFGHMVRQGYPMIWRPSRYEWRALEVRAGGVYLKTVIFEDTAGIAYEAEYVMGRTDGVWRIRAVSLRRLPGVTS